MGQRKVIVVGAGPVGCLAALAMAKMGCEVDVYEGRPDIRQPSVRASMARRSVNLAISSRGLAALEFVDPVIASRFLETVIPMRGRVIHSPDGTTEMQVYDSEGRCINSIDRGLLNEGLLDEISKHNLITVHFEHKLVTADFDDRVLVFESKYSSDVTEKVSVTFDLCIGADGSYSNVRRQLMRVVRMDYEQIYIPHEYIELRMPAGPASTADQPKFALDPNGLHIWPRHSFMLIALPNKDGSFTCTLFAPSVELSGLQDRQSILNFFQMYFPDSVALIGEDQLVEDILHNPRSPLISIKTNPYHYKDRVILVGDAAHSMVPFYGQGLNCGLEDVRILASLMVSRGLTSEASRDAIDGIDKPLEICLREYTNTRHEDLVAICDLAMQNYVEMRHSVTTRMYRISKALDAFLARILPSPPLVPATTTLHQESSENSLLPRTLPRGWISLYTMVTFRPDIPYGLAKAKHERQKKIVGAVVRGCLGGLMVTVGIPAVVYALRVRARWQRH